jgi:hypothetical protein
MSGRWVFLASQRCRFVLLATTFASGCSPELTGVFRNEQVRYEFFRDGRAAVTENGAAVAGRYEVKGNRVVVTTEGEMRVLRRAGDELIAPDGGRLRVDR